MPTSMKSPGEGVAPVCDMLKRWTSTAADGDTVAMAIIAVGQDGDIRSEFAGIRGQEATISFGAQLLQQTCLRLATERSLGDVSTENYDWDKVRFLRTHGPHSFDFFIWLVAVEMERRKYGAPAPLKLWFEGEPQQTETNRKFFYNVMRPALRLLGVVESAEASQARLSAVSVTTNRIVEMFHEGVKIPYLTPSPEASAQVERSCPYETFVTVTLREAETFHHRNSNLPEWLRFASWLRERGENVVFVRDTARSHVPLDGWTTFPSASVELDTRVALYEKARCNLFVSNGPWMLAVFCLAPWICFNPVSEGDSYHANHPSWWERFQGIGEGKQFPWSTDLQRIVWKPDLFDIMKEAWLDWDKSKEK